MSNLAVNYVPAFNDITEIDEVFLPVINNNINHIHDLFKIFSDNTLCNKIIVIDIEKFNSDAGLDLVSFLDSLITVINYTCNIICKPKIVIAVDLTTPPTIIKLLLGTKINGLYPRGEGFSTNEKLDCITKISEGVFYVPTKIKDLITNKKITSIDTFYFTPRQEQIISLIQCRGASNKVIANILHISESTVKLHISHIFKKCGVKNRTQLVLFLKK